MFSSSNEYNPSKVRYTEKVNAIRSPNRFQDNLGSPTGGFLSLPGGTKDIKQARSVSRGRPSTATNNLA